MHLRFSSCIGTPVAQEGLEGVLGVISGILIHPDTAKIEGFFVRSTSMRTGQDLFCGSQDIVRWGTRVYITDLHMLAPVSDRIRLQPLLEDGRQLLGQRIQTVSGVLLGICGDVQFNTESMRVEWLFPRKWFSWKVALPASDIQEVTHTAITVADPLKKEPVQDDALEHSSELSEMEAKLS